MKKLILTLSSALFLLLPLTAQELETGYFLGGNPFAFRLNPAFQSERNIVSIGLGMTGMGLGSNLGFNTLLYPDASGNKLYSFLNDHVTAEQLLSKLQKNNYLGADAQVNLVTVGFWSDRDFFTVDLNLRSSEAVNVPYDVFRFLKGDKSAGAVFECSDMGLRSNSIVEAAFGWSRALGDGLKVGARAKLLMGVLGADARLRRMRVEIQEDSWKIESHGVLAVSSPAVSVGEMKDSPGTLDPGTFQADWSKFSPAGWGGAVDLGFSWEPVPLLTLSGALLDLGAIRWNRELVYTVPEASYEWAPSVGQDNASQDYQSEISKLLSLSSSFLNWKRDPGAGAAFAALPFRLNAGAEFRMPFYDRLSVGALYQGRFGAAFGRHTGRLSVNWNPLDFLSLSTGMGFNRLGESFGFALNLHPTAVNFVLGCDYVPFHCVDASLLFKGIPAKYAILPRGHMNLNLHVGLNIAFGQNRLDHAKRFVSK